MASLSETRRDQMFPVLGADQVTQARRFAAGQDRRFEPGEVLFAIGTRDVPAFLVLQGCVEIVLRDAGGRESVIVRHGPGQITGEVSQLAGRVTLAEGRAGMDGCTALAFDAAHLRALVIGSAEIGEAIMRAYILRRIALINEGGAGSVLIGSPRAPELARLQGFLARNGYPVTVLDPAADPEAAAIIERFGVAPEELPVALCPNGTLLRRPTDAEIALSLGITPDLDPTRVFDVAVVGAGPAGLATAVYAASEGLEVIVLDARAPGGQAGASARIENYLGFPTGISGQALSGRAFTQAQKFGAELAIPLQVARLECGGDERRPGDLLRLHLADGRVVCARSVVVASGARYRRPDIAGLEAFEGAGVSYWASPVEAKLCAGEDVALVGAGNSAGQAVAFLAPRVRRLHLVVRGNGLEASMSRYLIERIAALPNVELHLRTEITAFEGTREGGLTAAGFRNRDTGEARICSLRHVFLFIGADPNTDWLQSCAAAVDARGFVRTGEAGVEAAWANFNRTPASLETSIPGVFAIGDVRAGSTKRVAAAVGEGAAVVAQLHGVLSAQR